MENSNSILSDATKLVNENGMNMLRNDHIETICMKDDKVVGVLYYSFENETEEIHWSIVVHKDHRNKGIAKKLYEYIKSC